MHLINDETGNTIHHHHDHDHNHDCDHNHNGCDGCGNGDGCKDETVALLTYMVQHNEHHALELDQMADNLIKLGMEDAAKTIKDGVADFQKANMRFSLALAQVKAQVKED